MTTHNIELEYRLLPCGCCFIVSNKGLPVCHTADPIPDTAQFLAEAGVPEDTTVSMTLEGSNNVGMRYMLSDVLEAFEPDVPDVAETRKRGGSTVH